MKTLTTTKKFYDKWLYKVTIDVSQYSHALLNFNKFHNRMWEPDLTNTTLDTPNVIAVKKLPYGKYRFKVFLKPHKILDPAEKQEYIKWMNTQVPRITFSEAIQDWIMYTRWSGDARYILVSVFRGIPENFGRRVLGSRDNRE